MNKLRKRIHAAGLAAVLLLTGISFPAAVSAEDTVQYDENRVNVHDPSIVRANDTYYVFGSHMADAKSDDLIHWTQTHRDYDDTKTNSIYGDVVENFSESFEWAGYQDGFAADIQVWAPDVIYNPKYKNDDGTLGAYMLYYSVTSSWCRSCIGYAVSKDVEGPYKYVDTIVYSGFSKNGKPAYNDNTTRDTTWDNDYLNLKELTELGAAGGGIDGISDRWFTTAGGWNEQNAPNAIDPTVFFDERGRLYMTYGSWSGGIFLLRLNDATGAPVYPGVDGTDSFSENFIDRYFGTHLAGGNHQSGEGPYILYDEKSQYYYMYETYGGLAADGGYNMRLFRSVNVTGPYLDAAGNNAANSGVNNNAYGIKLIGNYQFTDQPGYRSAGHNSALIDDDGQHYLVYHQRFNQRTNSRLDHEVRVHQQFMNQDDWPVTAVYEYKGESISHYTADEVAGEYELINHGTDSSSEMLAVSQITLNSDGTISGDLSGTWTKTAGETYDFAELIIDGIAYQGVFFRQTSDKGSGQKAMTFSVVGTDNACLWGSKPEAVSDDSGSSTGGNSGNNSGNHTGDISGGAQTPDPGNTQNPSPNPDTTLTPSGSAAIRLTGKTSYKKVYGDKPFSLKVSFAEGSGTLTYRSSDSKTISVSQSGKVTIKSPGKAVITVTAVPAAGYEASSMQITVTAAPKKTSISSLKTDGRKKLKVTWKKSSKATGYVVEYATNRSFKKAKKKTVKTTKLTLKGLKSKKTYYVRIRPYVKNSSGTVYGAYSSVKKKAVK